MAEIIHDMAQLQRKQPTAQSDHDTDAAQLREAIKAKLTYVLAKNAVGAGDCQRLVPSNGTRRARPYRRRLAFDAAGRDWAAQHKRRVYYLSIEFLIGRLLFVTP